MTIQGVGFIPTPPIVSENERTWDDRPGKQTHGKSGRFQPAGRRAAQFAAQQTKGPCHGKSYGKDPMAAMPKRFTFVPDSSNHGMMKGG